MSVIERAIEIHYATFPRADVSDGLAHPFGAVEHEPHCWRVAQDVWDEIVALRPKYSVQSAPMAGDRLLGEHIVVDDSLAPGSMVLEPIHDG